MKKTLLSLFAALSAFGAAAQIPNAGFENWSNSAGYNAPDNWDNLNSMTSPMSVYTAEKGTPGSPGTSYLKLTSRNVSGMGVMPGIAATGTINMTTFAVTGGFPNTTRPASLTGKWQYMSGDGVDMGFVAAYLTKWNMTTMQRDTVATAMNPLMGMVMSWGNFTAPFTYTKGFNPDTAVIILSASGTNPAANSYLYVDNLTFSGSVAPTSVANAAPLPGVNIFPNPATSEITVTLPDAANYSFTLSDLLGKVVRSQSVNAAQISLNTNGLPAGEYILTVSNGKQAAVNKVSIR
jgi:hypothetical protein